MGTGGAPATPENNQLWDDSGEAARNGRQYMDYVESHLLDMDERIKIMDGTGIERTILSLTSPDIQSITDTELAAKVARVTNDLVKSNFVDKRPDRLSMFACLPIPACKSSSGTWERDCRTCCPAWSTA